MVFDNRINVFFGSNGAGKTSLLEAIYFLSTGKSFRSKRTKNLINNQQDDLTVFAKTNPQPNQVPMQLGINLNKNGKKQIKLNQDLVRNQSDIAHRLPVVSIDPDSYLFIDKPPQYRRSFLDWLVFHVKHEYLTVWSQCSRCQKQLNALYKAKSTEQLDYWEQQYINHANALNQLRLDVFADLQLLVEKKTAQFIPELSTLKVGYYQGWSKDNSLVEQLNKDRDKNLMYGNLNSGVHKMDVKNTIKHMSAQECLSRGQKKMISIIYYLSFIELITAHTGIDPVLCLDDMDAELDINKTQILCDFIQTANNQVFISTVDKDKLIPMLDGLGLFHVKHNQQVTVIQD